MKAFYRILFFICLASCHPNEGFVKVKGSDSVLPITQKEAEVYMEQNPESGITVTGGGSGVGLAALIDGTTDIAMSSREIKVAEKLRLKDKSKKLIEEVVAYDALALVVHPSNPVKELLREDVEAIYTGKIENWKELGGSDQKIVAYARESSSGTYEFFKEVVMEEKEYASQIISSNSNGAILQSISQTKGGLGYIGLAYLNENVKPIGISFDEGENYVLPSFDNAKAGRYPVSRPLYYYFTDENREKIRPFLEFVFSPAGQSIVTEIGYVPVK